MMDDVIYRKDAIRVLNAKCKKAFNLTCGEEDCACPEYTALRDLPSAQQWIPWVDNDDRLKNHYYYLVTHVGIAIPALAQFHDDGCYFEIISMYPHKSIYVWDNDIITAWMPLPEIYKGEE